MLLELVMIVKNAGNDFAQILSEVQPYVDAWTILDTGSEDETVDIINRVMVDKPGKLHVEDFVDFSTSRNRALDLSSKSCEYQLMMDDSYIFQDGEGFRKELKNKLDVSAFNVYIKGSNQEYLSLRLIRTDSGFRYKGKIHEYIDVKDSFVGEMESFIVDRTSKYFEGRTKARDNLSKQLMLNHINDNPKDRRMITHLVRHLMSKCTDKDLRGKLRAYIDLIVLEKNFDTYDLECRLVKIHCDCLDNEGLWTKGSYLDLCKIDMDHPGDPRVQYMLCLCSTQVGTKLKAFQHICKTLTCSQKSREGSYLDPSLFNVEIPYQMADIALQVNRGDIAERVLKDSYPANGDTRLFNMILSSTNYPQPRGESLGPVEVVVFHATGTVKGWSPDRYKGFGTTPGSGSEIMLAGVARQFSNFGYRVIVFGDFCGETYNTEGIYDGVQYIDQSHYIEFLLKYIVDHLFVSRDINNIVYTNNVHNVYLWVHDVLPLSGAGASLETIQVHPKKFKRCLVLCDWHKNKVIESTSIPSEMVYMTRNAIDVDRISLRKIESLRPKFVYTSSVDRGLEHTIKCFNLVRKKFPEAILDIYSDVSMSSSNYKGNMKDICELCKSPGVTVVGRREHSEVLSCLTGYDIWLYPTDFYETYCIAALECQAAGLLCVTTSFGSLSEIVGDRGYVSAEKDFEVIISELSRYVIGALSTPDLTNDIRKSAYEWGRSQDFGSLVSDWKNNFLALH